MTDAIMAHFQESFAELGGVRVRYLAAGKGEPLLLVHGLGGAASNWVELAPLLAARRRVLVPDLPGHGGSEPLAEVPDLDVLADLLGELGEREALWPGAVVGHSLGGTLGLRLAARRPGDVTALVLAAAAGISSCSPAAGRVLSCISVARPARLVVPFRGPIARRPLLRYLAFTWWGASDPPALSERATAGLLAAAAAQTDPWTAGRALVRHDPRLDLHRVTCPCLCLWGARDNWVPLRDGFEYARRLGAPLRAIAGCGHLLIAERPDVCAEAILEFLDRVGQLEELPVEVEALR